MKTSNFALFGGEDNTFYYNRISSAAQKQFQCWWNVLASPCLQDKNAFLDLPVSEDSRLFIQAIKEKNGPSRALVWYLGVELTKLDYQGFSSYHNVIQGILSLQLDTVKAILKGSGFVAVPNQFPSNLPPIQTPFEQIAGKNFYGDNIHENLKIFCQQLSMNDIDGWFSKLFLAVNVVENSNNFTNIIADVPPSCEPHEIETINCGNLSKKRHLIFSWNTFFSMISIFTLMGLSCFLAFKWYSAQKEIAELKYLLQTSVPTEKISIIKEDINKLRDLQNKMETDLCAKQDSTQNDSSDSIQREKSSRDEKTTKFTEKKSSTKQKKVDILKNADHSSYKKGDQNE